jgi:Ni/Fe-hydrogenase subunit HybB-like protein
MAVMGVAAGLARLLVGMGATTNLSDAYPWGIWIGFDFALIAFSGAGFTLAAVVHVLHLHQFEPALRPALFAGLFGYVAVLLLLVLDLGRPDRFYHFLIYWNLHSPLFEISCTLYVNMPYRLHPLWYTPYLPSLFFVSSVMVGLSVAVLAYQMAACVHRRCAEVDIPQGLSVGIVGAALIYFALRLTVLGLEDKIALALMPSVAARALWLEMGIGVLLPSALFVAGWRRPMRWINWVAPVLVMVGVGMNRFNATLTGQSPAWPGDYVPHLLEWFSTLGILAAALLLWLLAVRFLVPFQTHSDSSHMEQPSGRKFDR